ncbi:MAG: GGDEF domain-containing protein [Nitrosomonadales bacterium]|nr:GGDEF domain-containing protein [Nitrosomonadales bacterium]
MSLTDETYDLLKDVPLFFGVSHELLIRYLDESSQISLAAGQTLLSPGESNEKIYIILSGRMRVNSAGLSDSALAIFGTGESVGEMSILDDSRAHTYLIADTDCELLSIDHSTIWALINDSHQAARNMLNVLALRISISEHSLHVDIESRQGYAGLNHVDELTGLYNSDWMHQMFSRQIHRCAMNQGRASLMMMGIDQFKHYNQCHGRLGGDQALRTIAQTTLACLRPNDQAARYHGKVFAVFLPHTSLAEAHKAAERLRMQASRAAIVTPSGDALPSVTISIGLAEVRPGLTLEQLLEQTDFALQRARLSGRNCISD